MRFLALKIANTTIIITFLIIGYMAIGGFLGYLKSKEITRMNELCLKAKKGLLSDNEHKEVVYLLQKHEGLQPE